MADESDGMGVVLRDTSEPMSETEFMQWMNTNFGTMGLRDALQQAAFMLCVDVISQDISKSTLRLKERLDNNTSKVVLPTKHQMAGMLALEPNIRHTWSEFTEMLVMWFCISKNALAGVTRTNTGDVLEILPFQTTRILEKVNGREVFYDVTAGTMAEQALLGSPMRTFAERDMIHVRGRMLNGMDGLSTMDVGRTTLTTGEAIETFRTDLFGDDGQMRGVFKKSGPGAVNEIAYERLKASLRIMMARFKAGGDPVVLEDGMEFQTMSSRPMEMELTKQLQQQILATCRLLRVPPHKVFEMEGAKYENLETQEKMYVGDTLLPIVKAFEARYARTLLSTKDRLRFFFEYDRDEMTLRDTKAETERAVKALERGGIDFDEFRARLGYNPYPNGQGKQRLIPVNMNVVDEHGKIVIGGAAAKEEPKSEDEGADPATEESTSEKGAPPQLRIVS